MRRLSLEGGVCGRLDLGILWRSQYSPVTH